MQNHREKWLIWVNNKNNSSFRSGHKTTIPLQTEELLVDATKLMEDLSWSIDMSQLKFIVATFIQEMGIKSPFKKNKTGIYNNSTCQRF